MKRNRYSPFAALEEERLIDATPSRGFLFVSSSTVSRNLQISPMSAGIAVEVIRSNCNQINSSIECAINTAQIHSICRLWVEP